jgi:hypothetical protein
MRLCATVVNSLYTKFAGRRGKFLQRDAFRLNQAERTFRRPIVQG